MPATRGSSPKPARRPPLAKGLSRIAIEAKSAPIGFAVAAQGGRAPLVKRIRRLGQADGASGADAGVSAFAVTMLFLGAIAITIGADAIAPRGVDAAAPRPVETAMEFVAAPPEWPAPVAAARSGKPLTRPARAEAAASPLSAVSAVRPEAIDVEAVPPVAAAQAIAFAHAARPNGAARVQFATYRVTAPAVRRASADDDCPEERAAQIAEKAAAAVEREAELREARFEREQARREVALASASESRAAAAEQIAERMAVLREQIETNNERIREEFERRMERKADRYEPRDTPTAAITISLVIEGPSSPIPPAMPVTPPTS